MGIPPVSPGASCPVCGKPVPGDLLERLHGTCSRCLLAFTVEEDEPDFPNVKIVSTIGRGGMGVVYKAEQPSLGRTVALKVLSPALLGEPRFMERFSREAAAMARLRHPNIVTIHDFGVHGGIPYLVMEHIEGNTLRKQLGAGPLPPVRAMKIASDLCEALASAHGQGVVHRDVKPENILIDREGRVKITDFGLAQFAQESNPVLTGPETRLGTPNYIAPEQIERSHAVDHRADLYSLGVVLYEMLTGELPIGHFKPPSKIARVDSRVDPLVLRLLEKSPESRLASAAAVKSEIDQLRSKRRCALLWVGGGVMFGAIILAYGLGLERSKPVSPPPSFRPEGVWEELGHSTNGIGLNRTGGPTFRPSLCMDNSGRPVVSWRDDSSGKAAIYLRRWNGESWVEVGGSASGGGVSGTPGIPREPSVAIGPDDHPVVSWMEEMGGESEIYLRKWDGKSWVELEDSAAGGGLSRAGGEAAHPALALDPSGFPVVAWYGIPKLGSLPLGRHRVYLKRWDGQRWRELGGSASGGGISKSPGEAYMPSLSLDHLGNPTVVWHDNSSGNFEIYLRQWDGKMWNELGGSASGGGVSNNHGNSWTPKGQVRCLQLDRKGNPIVAWYDDTPGNKEIYLRAWNGQAWMEMGGSASGGGISNTPTESYHPSLALTRSGQLAVAWQEQIVGESWKIFLRYWDGQAWSALGDSATTGGVSSPSTYAVDPVLAFDREGRPVVAWSDGSPGRPMQIYIRRWRGTALR